MTTYVIVKQYLERLEKRRQFSRIYRIPATSAFSLEDAEFKRSFSLSKRNVRSLCRILQKELIPKSGTQTAIPVEIKVLCTLRYLTSGSFQREIARDVTLNISQAAVSRCVVTVSEAICKILMNTRFPPPCEYEEIKEAFNDIGGFPGVIGAVGCSHIKIIAPPNSNPAFSQHAYLNPLGHHSLNILLVCDAKMRITYVSAEYPGASMNWFIWKFSKLHSYLERNHSTDNCDSWLIGNANFQPSSYLLAPFKEPSTVSEITYNLCHERTLKVIESCIRRLKTKFRCLSWVLRHNPVVAERIIKSCVVLHNMCLDDTSDDEDIVLDEDVSKSGYSLDEEDKSGDAYVPIDESTNAAALEQRNNVVQMYFS